MSKIVQRLRRFFMPEPVEQYRAEDDEFVQMMNAEAKAAEEHRQEQREQRVRDRERWSNRSALERELLGGRRG